MCLDVMAAEGRKQREARTNWWRKKKSVCAGVVKATFRKYVGNSSPRKAGHGVHRPVWGKQKPAGAMAPGNRTQYLMELVYSEQKLTALSYRKENCLTPQHEQNNFYTSVFTDEETMEFQQRDFDSVFVFSE